MSLHFRYKHVSYHSHMMTLSKGVRCFLSSSIIKFEYFLPICSVFLLISASVAHVLANFNTGVGWGGDGVWGGCGGGGVRSYLVSKSRSNGFW